MLYLRSTFSPYLTYRARIPFCHSQFQGANCRNICSLASNTRNIVLVTGAGRELVKDMQRREGYPISYGFVSLRVGSLEEARELVVGERARPRLLYLGSRNAPAPVCAELESMSPIPRPGPTGTCEGHNAVSVADALWQSSCSLARGRRTGRRLKPSKVGWSRVPASSFTLPGVPLSRGPSA